ncbi:SGNH/GDSL hydrolase family protein [Simplicispira psychrophila]|uniref:SGNH/GDSL hydrolase family protein n=1 Tax=Simplicispira psychrophila TaxID=80882 RepID=UPI000480B9A5|nr:SGNH/GDSL hydrolase family protein [Simplicispira psychrophila]
MAVNWLRRSVLAAAGVSAALLLAGCGSSTIESALKPQRLISFGDGFSDIGQVGGARYTVNDGSVNNWTLQLATTYGLALTPASAGGTSYAQGNARVTAHPDAAGNASTPTVTEQIDKFLATGNFKETDVVLIGAGAADIVAQMAAVTAGTQTPEQMLLNAQQAGRDLGAQVIRTTAAGAKYVVVAGTYNLGRSPWATAIGQTDGGLLTQASSKFNAALLVSIVDQGAKVLYVDAAYYFNLLTASHSSYAFDNATTAVCTSVDTGPGIGIGAAQVNSALCTASTLLPGADSTKYVFADTVYFTPAAQRLFGTYAYDRLHARW